MASLQAHLQIRLFGPLDVRIEGEPLPSLRTRKDAWLLALLVLRHSRPVDRVWLAGTLWPDSDHAESLRNLRNSLHELRRALGTERERLESPTATTLRLNLAAATVDLLEYDAAIASGDGASLARAVQLYAGILLEGCTEEWVFQERTVREAAYLRALEMLAQQALEQQDQAQSIGYLERLLAADPMEEGTVRLLMQAQAQSGNYAAAVMAYRNLRLKLREQVNVDPDPETVVLYKRLRADVRRRGADVAAEAHVVVSLQRPKLPADLPLSRSVSVSPHNLLQPLTSFIGREKEIAEVRNLLEKSRLLTLTGSGGCGKTRLSLQVAADVLEQFPEGVWLVELAPLADPTLVLQTIASVLGLAEQVGKLLIQTLIETLKTRTVLLVLDNCEHLLTACAQLSDVLLRSCPNLKILASSRETLGIAGEQMYRVPSLSLPDLKQTITVESISQYEAARLFIERAHLHLPAFAVTNQNVPALVSVCHHLDGIPLAIELAAARVRSLSVEEIDVRLDNCFRLLTGGSKTALPRQQTLRALIDWSYELLNAQEKVLLARLAVFAGGWTLAAAEQVCSDFGRPILDFGAEANAAQRLRDEQEPNEIQNWEILDLLTGLVDKSLAVADTQTEATRYRLLETVRQYARDRLAESGESIGVRGRHRDHFLMLAEAARPKLNGSEQAHWLAILEEEHDNLRRALTWCLENAEGDGKGLRLGAALQQFWGIRGHLSEGRERLAAALSCPGAQEHTRTRADALNGAGNLARMQGDYSSARSQFGTSLTIRQELGDKPGIASCLNNLGNVADDQGDYAAARAQFGECLAIMRELGNKQGIAVSLNNLGLVAHALGDYAVARAQFEECLTLFRELGNKGGIANSLNNLGRVAREQGDYAVARVLFEESLAMRQELGDKSGIAISHYNLGIVAEAQGNYASARALYEESLAIQRELGEKSGIGSSLSSLGDMALLQGDYAAARFLLGQSLAIRRELGDKRTIVSSLESCAALAGKEKQEELAAVLWGAAQVLRESIGTPLQPGECEEHDQQVVEACATLGEAAFAAAWEKGRAMTMEQAVAVALGETLQ